MPRLSKKHYHYKKTFIFFSDDSPDSSTKVLRSEPFEVGVLEGTRWQLVLYPNGRSFQNFTSVYLQRTSCDTDIEEVFVDFSFECKETRNYVEFRNICFARNHCWGSPVFSRIPSHKTENMFKIVVRMSKSKLFSEIDVHNHKNDLEALSKDLLDMLMSGELFDLRLHCDGTQFLVHKCILAARCPKLAEYFEEELGTVMIRENISMEILKIILVYIYSAKLILPRVQILAELYIFAMSLEMTDLIQQIHHHPYFHGLDPEFNVDHLNFTWEINSELLESQPCSRTCPTKNVYTNKLIMTCETRRENSKFRILVSFNFDSFNTDKPIFLDFTIETEDINDRVIRLGCGSHVFLSNELWNRRIGKKFRKLPEKLKLICHIDLCDEAKCVSNHRDRIIHVGTSKNYCYYNRLPVDMQRFLNSEFLGDFSIVSNDKKEFKVHRTILAARSSVFQRMLHHNVKETITGRMEIDDIDSATLQLMISYMYSGMVYCLDLEESFKLYIAADKYDVQPLVSKCTSLILSNLNCENEQEAVSLVKRFYYTELNELICKDNVSPFSLDGREGRLSDAQPKYLSFQVSDN